MLYLCLQCLFSWLDSLIEPRVLTIKLVGNLLECLRVVWGKDLIVETHLSRKGLEIHDSVALPGVDEGLEGCAPGD